MIGDLGQLRVDVEHARKQLHAAAYGRSWPCPHCGNERAHGGDWWAAGDLHEAAGVDGPVAMIAMNELVKAGVLEQDARFRVRLALRDSQQTETES